MQNDVEKKTLIHYTANLESFLFLCTFIISFCFQGELITKATNCRIVIVIHIVTIVVF